MQNEAIAIILDEHRSLAAVLHGLRHLVREMRDRGKAPDFRLLGAMLYYLDAFSEKLHNPKESAYLFAKLRQRTDEADKVIDQLEEQHADSARLGRDLEHALARLEAGMSDGLHLFSSAVDRLMEEAWPHMAIEEKVLMPLARKYLTADDWAEIAKAFGENGDPRFGSKPDHEFRDLFSRIVNLAPPPIGVGPDR
ncbi:MAG TPA: hemerythrin domain-containing protein [Rhodocyclaceae bacterium]|nr:hemerythrin domain-containing protein [Rhodocyclaceae bacterium]